SFGEGIGAQQAAALGQYGQDRFATRNRMFVALRLALGMRIGEAMRVWLARLARGLRRLRTAARRRFLLVLAGFLLSARFARGTGRRAIAIGHCASVAQRRRESKSAARKRNSAGPPGCRANGRRLAHAERRRSFLHGIVTAGIQ